MTNEEEVKEIISFYALWATMIGVITMAIRPFISLRQLVRDTVITFLVSFFCGLLLEYLDIPVPVKCGLSGVAGLFALFIYGILVKLLQQVEKDPVKVITEIKNHEHK